MRHIVGRFGRHALCHLLDRGEDPRHSPMHAQVFVREVCRDQGQQDQKVSNVPREGKRDQKGVRVNVKRTVEARVVCSQCASGVLLCDALWTRRP